MKVAISCDHILGWGHHLEILKYLLEVFEGAEIYTLVHSPGAVLGTTEMRKIHSSHLSGVISTSEQYEKKSYLLPGAARALFIPCSVDLVFNISQGFSHGIKKCASTRQITYLHQDPRALEGIGWRGKFFRPYLSNWCNKKIAQVDELWVASEELGRTCGREDFKVVPIPFDLSNFPLFSEEHSRHFSRDFYVVDAEGIELTTAEKLFAIFRGRKIKFKFVGRDLHLEALKSKVGEDYFFGSRCASELAPLLAASMATVVEASSGLSPLSLSSRAVGRPVIVVGSGSSTCGPVGGKGVFRVPDLEGLADLLEQFSALPSLEGKLLRAEVMAHHDLKFKAQVRRKAEALVVQTTP